ncbi:MAG: VWA domain-containing protein [Bryobacteraceae bacterium]
MISLKKPVFLFWIIGLSSAAPAELATIRSGVSLVTIPVHVTTERGVSLTDLKREDFELLEDNTPQKIVSFSKQDAPLSVGFLLDASGSMRNRMRTAAESAVAFCKTANPGDEFFLIHFNERPKLDVPFTNNPRDILRQVGRVRPFGRTSLLDAISMALAEMKNARNPRKAIVVLSDGGDNRSRHTAGQIRVAMSESDVQLYAMGIFDAALEEVSREEQSGPDLLTALAEMTGGRHYPVSSFSDLSPISERIGLELRNQYVLGYVSTNTELDGKYRKVKLAVKNQNPALRTEYRRGYYAPTQ